MSRLIVKNLPNRVLAEQLKQKFGEKGEITDVQLKYAPNGRFRNFAFVGFKTTEQAEAALQNFHNSFWNTSKLQVEKCVELGSDNKPKAWSKYSKKHEGGTEKIQLLKKENEGKRNKSKCKVVDDILVGKIQEHKDDPNFIEFLETQTSGNDVLKLMDNDSHTQESEDEEKQDEEEGTNLSYAPISDIEYLKLKTKGSQSSYKDPCITKPLTLVKKKYDNLFTIKIKNLPKNVKKRVVKDLFKPLKPVSIRRAQGKAKGVAYIGFKDHNDLKKALVKNKTYLGGRQIWMHECIVTSPNENSPQNRWQEQEESLKEEEFVGESGRIFIRNLSYTVKEEDVHELFVKHGPLSEVVIPVDKFTRKIKGYGVVTFLFPEHAVSAYSALDGTVFHGRMLHLLPGKSKPENEDDSNQGTNFKQKKAKKMKDGASLDGNWNTLFLGRNAVAEVVAETYKTTKQDVLSGNEAAVRLALGETQLVNQTRNFLESNGVYLDAFNQENKKRSKNTILVKNLPAKTTTDEVTEKFEKFGVLNRVLLPPSGVTAIIEFQEPIEARAAFGKLAYSKFKNLPLYLEWAPENTFSSSAKRYTDQERENIIHQNSSLLDVIDPKDQEKESEIIKDSIDPEPETTLFVKNLNFDTTEDALKKHFAVCGQLANVLVARKKDTKQAGTLCSMGYGFVQYYRNSSLNEALIKLQGSTLDGHKLELKRSTRTFHSPTVLEKKKTNVENQTGKKILVRNIPFQATVKEIHQLFRTFGELKFVRLPQKMVGTGTHRGFAFVEYLTNQNAKQAMKALCQSTHLYGRRLVLEWAQTEENVEDIRKRTAKHFNSDSSKAKKKSVADIDIQEGDENNTI